MATPTYPNSAPPLVDIVPNQAVPTSAATSSFVVFNTDALTVSDTPLAPQRIIKGDDSVGSNIHIQPVPTGASAVDFYIVFQGVTSPGSTAYVRVYGEIPLIHTPQIDSPHKTDSSYNNPVANYPPQNQWIPLSDESGNYSISLDNTPQMELWDTFESSASTQSGGICGATTVFTRGCKRIMVAVEVATIDPDACLVAGCFAY